MPHSDARENSTDGDHSDYEEAPQNATGPSTKVMWSAAEDTKLRQVYIKNKKVSLKMLRDALPGRSPGKSLGFLTLSNMY